MAAGHDHAETDGGVSADWTVDGAVRGVPTVPVAAAPLDAGAAALVRTPARSWNGTAVGTPVLVPYSFATRDSAHYPNVGAATLDGFVPGKSGAFDSAQRGSVLQALAAWEQVSGLAFIEVPDAPERWFGGIRFLLEDIPSPGVLGQTASPLPSGAEVVVQRRLFGDASMAPGSDGFWTLLHEIGHAIGIKHPFEDAPQLPPLLDNTVNTVMSYRDAGNRSGLGPLDVAAAQHLYGTDAAEATLAVRWSRGPGGALHSTGNDAANTIVGFDIRDVVRAGGGDDTVYGQGGHDEIVPGNGSDIVSGGSGFDTVWAEAPRRYAALAEQAGTIALALPNGVDRLAGVETIRFFDGQASLHPDTAAGQVFRLYGAALGRGPDPIAFGRWVQDLESGATALGAVAADFAGSGEFAGRYGALDDTGFVSLLYANVLGRAPDAAGLGFWANAMANGTGRAGALLGFSEAAEHKQRTADSYRTGLWVPDPEAVDVLRAYVAVLDRPPDAGGLANWTAARENGLGQVDLVNRFVESAEFRGRFGGLSNRDFVDGLYRTALDRQADPDGLAAWTRVLDAGIDGRAGVALGFAASAEMTVKLTPLVQDGILLA